MKTLNYIKTKVMYFIARIFGRYAFGVDFSCGTGKSISWVGYKFHGTYYAKSKFIRKFY